MNALDFSHAMEPVALAIWGEPNKSLSKRGVELRWGSGGSKKIDVREGTWYDFEADEGGGVLDLIKREKGLVGRERFDFLRNMGIEVGDPDFDAAGRRDRHQYQDHPHAPPAERAAEKKGKKGRDEPKGPPAAVYDYTDAEGNLVYQVLKFEWHEGTKRKKTFKQRRPDGRGGWVYNLDDVERVPYRLPELLEDLANERPVCVVEGEKDVDRLRTLGVPATCNPQGAKSWPENFRDFFAGADVIVIPDNDKPGREHAVVVFENLLPVISSIRFLSIPGLPEKGDVSDWLDAGGTVEGLYDLIDTHALTTPPLISDLGLVSFSDLRTRAIDDDWIIPRFIHARTMVVLVGAPKTGKSFAALDMAIHIAMGRDWMGRRVEKGPVVYAAGEGQDGYAKRVKAWVSVNGDPGQIPFVLATETLTLGASADQVKKFIDELLAIGKRLGTPVSTVFLDTLARTMDGDENNSKDMRTFNENIRRVIREAGVTVVLVHHTGKDATKGSRGHSSLLGALDTEIQLTRDDTGLVKIRVSAQKDEETGVAHYFRLKRIVVGETPRGDEVSSLVVVPTDETERLRKVERGMTQSAKIAFQALTQCLLDHGHVLPDGVAPHGTKGVDWTRWRDFCFRDAFAMIEDESKRKAEFAKAGKELRARGWIGVAAPNVWSAK